MNSTVRRSLTSLATLFLSAALPLVANAAVTPGNACILQHNDALVLHRVLPRNTSKAHASQRKAIASVTLSRAGFVNRVALVHSSGDVRFDAAALWATEHTAFAPAARSCVAIDSKFGYAILSSAGGSVQTAVSPGSGAVVASRR